MSLVHAFDLLPQPPADVPSVVAIFGSDASLRCWAISTLTGDGDVSEFDGDSCRWPDIRDELATASLFDFDSKRNIVLRDADKFVSDHRPEIEKYVAKPGTASRLILELGSLASNTRLYKAVLKDHLLVACGVSPDQKTGVTAASRRKFLTTYVAKKHATALAPSAADALIEMMGDDIGTLDTEIAKLALYCDPGETISEPLVREIVAGWQGKTVWQINDAIASGDAAEALRQLDKLMTGGQKPIALLPQIAWSLRRFGMATAAVEHGDRIGRKCSLEQALGAAGFRRPGELSAARSQLKSLTRVRGKKLLPWLLEADLRLKGSHSADGRDRFLLEYLVLRLANTP